MKKRKVILPVSRDEGKVEKEVLVVGHIGALPWQCPEPLSRK